MPAAPETSPLQNSPGQAHTPSHAAGAAAGCHSILLMNRVGRVLQDLSAARSLTDAEIRQHAADCTSLMEQAHARFEEFHNPADREEAVLWMHRRDEANRSLSPEFKAAREAQVLRAAAAGPGGSGCYFMDEGDRARAALAGRPAA